MTNNALIKKYEELYGKKEEPKLPRPEDYKDEKTIADELKERKVISTSNAKVQITPNPSSLISYDYDSGNDSFLQIAEIIKNRKGQVTSMTMNTDMMTPSRKTIEFSVDLWD